MELSLKTTQLSFIKSVTQVAQQFIQPFLEPDQSLNSSPSFIMPLSLVEQRLHDHYVMQVPIDITYEYYDQRNQIQQAVAQVFVERPIRADRRFIFKTSHTDLTLILHIDQILRADLIQ